MLWAGIALAVACLLVLYAAAASASSNRIEDGKRETAALAANGRVDIIRASAARFGSDLRFTITMRKRVRPKPGNERPLLLINTRGGGKSEPEYALYGNGLFKLKPNDDRIGDARLTASGRTWSYRFDPGQIPGLNRYGWAALTSKGPAEDVAPNRRYVKAQA